MNSPLQSCPPGRMTGRMTSCLLQFNVITGSELRSWVGWLSPQQTVSPQSPAWLTPQLKKPRRPEGQLQAPPWLRAAQEANLSLPPTPLTPQCLPPPPFPQPHRTLPLDSQSMEDRKSPHPQYQIISQEHVVNSGPEGGVGLKRPRHPALYSTVPCGAFHQNILLSVVVSLLSPYHCSGTVNNGPTLSHLLLPTQDYAPPWPPHRRLQGKETVPTQATQPQPQGSLFTEEPRGTPHSWVIKIKLIYTLWPYKVPPGGTATWGDHRDCSESLGAGSKDRNYKSHWEMCRAMMSQGRGGKVSLSWLPAWMMGLGPTAGHTELLRVQQWLWRPPAGPGAG